jgi:hypothetical protein
VSAASARFREFELMDRATVHVDGIETSYLSAGASGRPVLIRIPAAGHIPTENDPHTIARALIDFFA